MNTITKLSKKVTTLNLLLFLIEEIIAGIHAHTLTGVGNGSDVNNALSDVWGEFVEQLAWKIAIRPVPTRLVGEGTMTFFYFTARVTMAPVETVFCAYYFNQKQLMGWSLVRICNLHKLEIFHFLSLTHMDLIYQCSESRSKPSRTIIPLLWHKVPRTPPWCGTSLYVSHPLLATSTISWALSLRKKTGR